MKKFILIAAMILVPAVAQAGSRSLTLASNETAVTPQVKAVEPARAVEPAKTAEAPVGSCDAKATDAKATEVKATEAPQFVERPAAIDTAAPAEQPKLDAKPVVAQTPKATKSKSRHSWTEARIIGELHRHGIYW